MKKLTCEMCGGTDLLKQGGVFVCQSCGTKYSVEEAKKMMVEGTVEVQGIVQVANTAQLDNLLKLAQSAYESKNYAKAEEFCNQIIAMDSSCYEAWKLKGEAINYQISLTNDRITEVYNCIMTSYRVLDEAGKEKHREEVLKALRDCLEGEITFVLKQFIENRPSENLLMKVTTTFANCGANIVSSYEELGYSPEETEAYKVYIRNFFIKGVNAACNSSWDNVYYRYYRNGFTEEYRPDADILTHYMLESEYLLKLLRFAEAMFDAETDPADKCENYRQQNYIQRMLQQAESYKRMVKTTTNGYGAVVKREEFWQLDKTPTEETKRKWRKEVQRTFELHEKAELERAQKDPDFREKRIQECKKKISELDVDYAKHNRLKDLWYGVGPGTAALLIAVVAFVVWTFFSPRWDYNDGSMFFALLFLAILLIMAYALIFILYTARKKSKSIERSNREDVAYQEKRIQEFENAAENVEEEEKNAYV